MNKRATLKDIARETGVHVSTVSRALDPKRDTPLSEDVVVRVRDAAERLGYRPNRIASSLRTRKTMTIGVVIPDITNPIFPPIVRGIESVMEPRGYASIIVNTDSQRGRDKRLIEILLDRGVDGIIHTAVLLEDPTIVKVARSGLPVITLNRKIEGTGIPYLINDEEDGIRKVFSLLYNHGHRRIAHLAGPLELSTGQLRLDAFRKAATDMGLDSGALAIAEAEQFDEQGGREATAKILAQDPHTTAILCANDRLALGAIDHCAAVGLACPDDISVTGFNDMPFLDMIPPRLTTVRIQQFEAGAAAAGLLVKMLSGQGGDVPGETILPVQLMERDSVSAPRADGIRS
ncbi:transcriptional regulator, LacI family [Poseidonocella pacifica]|uniref:Transcriptional regulator, LacI family n=1 Tax=Poseidonocella pacifica TaxID=871651 RepID=A0A1I0V2C4_9RHOB|nr:LacI family DNA-binding transcriptional regulator [Poseidonocella pacifica]SFA70509.1 transcriptional regulator, LacI family [Poseidonocella pacifica]